MVYSENFVVDEAKEPGPLPVSDIESVEALRVKVKEHRSKVGQGLITSPEDTVSQETLTVQATKERKRAHQSELRR
jgi:hypothetical protein